MLPLSLEFLPSVGKTLLHKHNITTKQNSQGRGSDWLRVTKAEPCFVCGKFDWCLISADGSAAICARVKSERPAGSAGWLHRHDGDFSALPLREVKRVYQSELASCEVRDKVYRALLAELSLSDAHRANLRARGLSDDDIEAGLYRSLPRDGRPALAQKLALRVSQGDLPPLAGVPGFYMVSGELSYANLAGSVGMLIPVKNCDGLIIGLMVRCDDDSSRGGKYKWVSSAGKFAGCSPGAPAHIAGAELVDDVAIVTEGSLKADIASRFLGVPVIGVSGVGNWRPALDAVKQLDVKYVKVAFDMDKISNPAVKHHLDDMIAGLLAAKFVVYELNWPPEFKGIDDYLAAKTPYLEHHAKLNNFSLEKVLFSLPVEQKTLRLKNLTLRSGKKTARDKVYAQHYAFLNGESWQSWHSYLESRDIYRPLDCLRYGYAYRCDEPPIEPHVVYEPKFCGDRWHCVVDGYRYEQTRAGEAMDAFQAISDKVAGQVISRFVFTLPRELWGKIGFNNFSVLNRLAIDTMAEYYGSQPAGVLVNQWWHTDKPLPDDVKTALYPHIHAAFSNVVKLGSYAYSVAEPHINEARLKDIWARRLAKRFNLKYRFDDASGKPQICIRGKWRTINLRLAGYVPFNDEPYIYSRGKRKGEAAPFSNKAYLRARLRYDMRMPQRDIADYGDKLGLESFNAKQLMMVDSLIGRGSRDKRIGRPLNFRGVRWVGWLADGVKSKNCAQLGIHIPSAKERRAGLKNELDKPVICPQHNVVCSREYVTEVADSGALYQMLRIVSKWDLRPGDVVLDANHRNNGLSWLLSDDTWSRWHNGEAYSPALLSDWQSPDSSYEPIAGLYDKASRCAQCACGRSCHDCSYNVYRYQSPEVD